MMSRFILLYIGDGKSGDPEKDSDNYNKYMEWLGKLNKILVSPANPLKDNTIVKSDRIIENVSVTGLSGYTIIEAANIKEAAEISKGCPFLDSGGVIEIAELIQMNR
ncbi:MULTISPECIES: YciI family protein [Melioribacter]|nr:YciI family protein [Melioribacter roseus]